MTEQAESFSFEFDYSDNHCGWAVEEAAGLLPTELTTGLLDQHPEEVVRFLRSQIDEHPDDPSLIGACNEAIDFLRGHDDYRCMCAQDDAQFEIEFADELLGRLPEGTWALDPSGGQEYDYTKDTLTVEHLFNQVTWLDGWSELKLRYDATSTTLEASFCEMGRGSDSVTARLLSPTAVALVELWSEDSGEYWLSADPAATVYPLSDSLLELAIALREIADDNGGLPQSIQDILHELVSTGLTVPDETTTEVILGLASDWQHPVAELVSAAQQCLAGRTSLTPVQGVLSLHD